MDWYKKIRFKFFSMGIIYSLISWALFLNYYSETNWFQLLITPVKYSLNLTYSYYSYTLKTFSGYEKDISAIETVAFSLCIIIFILLGLILSEIVFLLFKCLYKRHNQ